MQKAASGQCMMLHNDEGLQCRSSQLDHATCIEQCTCRSTHSSFRTRFEAGKVLLQGDGGAHSRIGRQSRCRWLLGGPEDLAASHTNIVHALMDCTIDAVKPGVVYRQSRQHGQHIRTTQRTRHELVRSWAASILQSHRGSTIAQLHELILLYIVGDKVGLRS